MSDWVIKNAILDQSGGKNFKVDVIRLISTAAGFQHDIPKYLQ